MLRIVLLFQTQRHLNWTLGALNKLIDCSKAPLHHGLTLLHFIQTFGLDCLNNLLITLGEVREDEPWTTLFEKVERNLVE